MVMTIPTDPGRAMMAARDSNALCAESDHSRGDCATCIGSGKRGVLAESQYREERQICDAAAAYADSIMCDSTGKRVRNYLTAEEAAAPVYAACSNDMRGRVEQFELLNDPPERFGAYIGQDGRSVTVWTGLKLGTATETGSWQSGGRFGTRLRSYVCRIGGREYRGRSQGSGMFIGLTETAASKRNRESGK